MSRLMPVVPVDSRQGQKVLERLAGRSGEVLDSKVVKEARSLVGKVRKGGDRALLKAVAHLDGTEAPSVAALRLGPPDPEREHALLPAGFAEALERTLDAVERYHRLQVHPGFSSEEHGITLEQRRVPLARVGLYVPGGRAVYPSTVVMSAVPARVAGVPEIVVATPPGAYAAHPALRYTLGRLGITEIWGMGGAHAIAALAYGTETLPRVDKVVGPGNAWVTAAKRLVSGDVAVDGVAGPTEVVIVADGGADPALVAADLLAQAEHDPRAAAILVTPARDLAKAVLGELEAQLEKLPTAPTARAALANFGCALLVAGMEEAAAVVEAIAPEHLQLVGAEAESLVGEIRAAGAIFVGASTPEVFGDYVAGPSHVLPTCGSARFASGLGVEDFIRRSHVVRFSDEAAGRWAAAAAILAQAEGLPAHAAAARRRLS